MACKDCEGELNLIKHRLKELEDFEKKSGTIFASKIVEKIVFGFLALFFTGAVTAWAAQVLGVFGG